MQADGISSRRAPHALTSHWGHGRALGVLALALSISLLASCARATSGGPWAAATPATTPTTPTAPTTRIGPATKNGCPGDQPPADAGSFTPDVIVSQNSQSPSASQLITLAQGQRLELRLVSTYLWTFSATDPHHILAGTTDEGWYDPALTACIWRFTATSTGDAQLSFSGPIVCPPLEVCPSDDQSLTYEVAVR